MREPCVRRIPHIEGKTSGAVQRLSKFEDIMDDFTNHAELLNAPQKSPVLVVIERHTLVRTCILSVLKRELTGIDVVEMATIGELSGVSGKDVCLIVLDTGDQPLPDPAFEDTLAQLGECCPDAAVALLSNRDDEATALAAMQRGVRGFFPTTIPVEVALAGVRLVLAGGVYRPLPIVKQDEAVDVEAAKAHNGAPELSIPGRVSGVSQAATDKPMSSLTPREQQVLGALKLGLPNKLIAARLRLSENTVKMHIQHIMRKCSAHNRTEAVLRWSGRLSGHNGHARSRISSSS
jgi:DNA-binding NarL/FixJ family response regulator